MKRIRSADQDYKPPGQWTMEGFLYVQEKRESAARPPRAVTSITSADVCARHQRQLSLFTPCTLMCSQTNGLGVGQGRGGREGGRQMSINRDKAAFLFFFFFFFLICSSVISDLIVRSPSRKCEIQRELFPLHLHPLHPSSPLCFVFAPRSAGMHLDASLLLVRERQQDLHHEQHGHQGGRQAGAHFSLA